MSASARATLERLEAAATQADAAGTDPKATSLALLDRSAQPQPAYLLGRGSVSNRQETVSLGFLQVLTRGKNPRNTWPGPRFRRCLVREGTIAIQRSAQRISGWQWPSGSPTSTTAPAACWHA